MLAIIPARGGSKGLPGKNIRNLSGKPLIAYSIEAALDCNRISSVVVSTDCKSIRDVALEFGATDIGLRPEHLATDESPAIDTYVHTLRHLSAAEGAQPVKELCVLLPTSPLRVASDIDQAIDLFQKSDADSVISYTQANHPIEWHRYINDDLTSESIFPENISNRQFMRTTFHPNGSIYVFKSTVLESGRYYTEKSRCYVMPRSRSVDIDTLEDFEYAEYLLSKR